MVNAVDINITFVVGLGFVMVHMRFALDLQELS